MTNLKWYWALILMLIACFGQIAASQLSLGQYAGPYLAIIVIVILSLYLNFNELIWLSLLAGFILDLYSGSDFGLNMAFFILLALVVKVMIKLNEAQTHLSFVAVMVIMATISYDIIMSLGVIIKNDFIANGLFLLRRETIELVINILFGLLFYGFVTMLVSRSANRALRFRPVKVKR